MDDLHEHIEEVFGDLRFERRLRVGGWYSFTPQKQHEKRTPLQTYKDGTRQQRARGIGPTRQCKLCHGEFKTRPAAKTRGRQREYCSSKCQNRAAKARAKAKVRAA